MKPISELLKLQQDLIAAVTPFTVESGDSAAFATTPDDPIINPILIDYVSVFVPKYSKEHFNPHVSTGVAPREYLDKMLAEPFEPFIFSPAERGCLPARPVRHGGEETKKMGFIALRHVAGL